MYQILPVGQIGKKYNVFCGVPQNVNNPFMCVMRWEKLKIAALGEYLPPVRFQDKANQQSSSTQHSCSLSRPSWGGPGLRQPGSSHQASSVVLHQLQNSPLLPVWHSALPPPSRRHRSPLFCGSNPSRCGSCFAQGWPL